MMINNEELDKITEAVVGKIREKYILVEKTFNLDPTTEEEKARLNTINMFIENIATLTCKYFKVDKAILMTQEKIKVEFHKSCWCIGHLCKEMPESPIPQRLIGDFFKKHHSTINHWQYMASKKMEKSIEFKYEVNEVKKIVEQSLKL